MDASHPMGCRTMFVGELMDRGADSPGVPRLVMGVGVTVRDGHTPT